MFLTFLIRIARVELKQYSPHPQFSPYEGKAKSTAHYINIALSGC